MKSYLKHLIYAKLILTVKEYTAVCSNAQYLWPELLEDSNILMGFVSTLPFFFLVFIAFFVIKQRKVLPVFSLSFTSSKQNKKHYLENGSSEVKYIRRTLYGPKNKLHSISNSIFGDSFTCSQHEQVMITKAFKHPSLFLRIHILNIHFQNKILRNSPELAVNIIIRILEIHQPL